MGVQFLQHSSLIKLTHPFVFCTLSKINWTFSCCRTFQFSVQLSFSPPVLHCSDYCSCTVVFNIGKAIPLTLLFFSKLSWLFQGLSFPYTFQNKLVCVYKKYCCDFDTSCIKLMDEFYRNETTYLQSLIFGKGAKAIQWSFQQLVLGQVDIHMQRKEVRLLHYNNHKS